MDPFGESPRPREELARAVNISCLVIPFEWSGELWPVGLALCVNPQLVVVVTRMPLSTVPPDFIQIMAFMNAIAPGRVVEGWVMDERRMAGAFNRDFREQLRGGGHGGLALEDTGLTLKESSIAGLAERGLFFSAAAATQFYLPHVTHIPRIAKDWAALGGDVSRFVDEVPSVRMILVWFRAPKFGEPHQDFTVAGPSYGEDWLAVVNEMAAAAGIIWTTVGGNPAAPDAYSCFRPIPVLNNLWSVLPAVTEARTSNQTYSLRSNQRGRTNRLVQFAFFYALAGRGNIFACTWRSGSAEGCFLFTGMPTVVLDASNESGFKRAASMCGALGNAHHVAVDREGAVGVRAALGGLLGLRVERPAREEDPHRDRRERERRDRDDSPGRDRERDRERDENRDRDRRDRERRERAPLDPAPRDRDRDRDRERDRDDRDRRAPTWCYDCDARIAERCRHCRRYVCDRCYRRGHQGGRCD